MGITELDVRTTAEAKLTIIRKKEEEEGFNGGKHMLTRSQEEPFGKRRS